MFGAYDNYFLPRSFFILELFSAVLLKVENGWRDRWGSKVDGCSAGNWFFLALILNLVPQREKLEGKNSKFGFSLRFFQGIQRTLNSMEYSETKNLKCHIQVSSKSEFWFKVFETFPWVSFLAVQKHFLGAKFPS